MKEYIAKLPTLTSPEEGETLFIYLAASKECISTVLVTERERAQVPIYFVSGVLQGAELNYPELEKLTLALVHTARQVLSKPEKSGRMAKWAIELGEHNIEFRVRHAIKGQVLADFITETDSVNEEDTKNSTQVITPKIESEEWKLYTDGASSSDGSCAGLMLVNLEGKEFTYALRFEFTTTNNEEEGTFEAKQPTIQQYLSKAKELIESFKSFDIEHVRRSQNKKADALSKLASLTFEHLAKEVLVEVLEKKSILEEEVNDLIQEDEVTWMTPL
ncbi:uncharacterized protein [Rutidosis leptorrhynchoides]|uniref:uncharacterized protein n=1 Tax=Rutidosis leptorrhynchoides TaxID=125765 RepID=UPI003A9A54A0